MYGIIVAIYIKGENMKKRVWYIVSFLVLLGMEILIALFVKDAFIRPYGGDILITILLCCFARIIMPDWPKLIALWVLVLGMITELLQLINIADFLGVTNSFLRVVMGSTFDVLDIVCYFTGCLIFFLAEWFLKNRKTV